MDNNQKLVSQIADLSRNLNLLNESLRKNTQSIQSLMETQEDKTFEQANTTQDQSPEISSISKDLKDISSVLTKIASADSPFSKIADVMGSPTFRTFDFGTDQEIKGKFQTGGVAKESGKYLVGENGPEVVSLPKGAGVLPIDAKDLIEGLRKVPELSDILKGTDIVNVTGSFTDKAILSSDNKRISLYSLINNYEDELFNLGESQGAEFDQKSFDEKKQNLEILEKLASVADKNLSEQLDLINQEVSKLSEKKGSPDILQKFGDIDKMAKEFLQSLSPDDDTDLGLARAKLEAQKMLLAKAAEAPEEKAESEESKKSKKSKKEESQAEAVTGKPDLKKMKTESEAPKETKPGGEEKKSGEGAEMSKFKGILGKFGKSGEKVLEGVAEKTGFGGAFKVAKAGLGLLSAKKGLEEGSGESVKTPGIVASLSSSETKMEAPAETAGGASSLETSISKLSAPAPKAETTPGSETKESSQSPEAAASKAAGSQESAAAAQSPESSQTPAAKSPSMAGPGGATRDLGDVQALLSRIASLLEGPLMVSNIDDPFRPNSRRV